MKAHSNEELALTDQRLGFACSQANGGQIDMTRPINNLQQFVQKIPFPGAGKGIGASQSAYGNISSTGSSFGWGSSFVSRVCGFFGFTQGQSVTQID